MEESYSWKIVYLAAIFSLIILGFAYYLISPRESPYFSEEKTDKLAEFKNTRVVGRKEGKTLWELQAESGWTEKNQEITHLNNVKDGKIYNKEGKLVLYGLIAPRAQAWRQTEVVEAFGPLKVNLDLGKFSAVRKDESEWTRMTGNHIKYFPSEKRSEMDGNLVLTKKDSTIFAEKILVDHERKIANISEKIRIKREDGIIRADSIEYLGEAEQLNTAGNVSLALKENKIKTFIKCNQGTLFLDAGKDISLSGSLEVTQGKKLSIAREGTYSQKNKGIFLRGGTRTILEKAQAILKEGAVKNLQNPEEKSILKGKTVISANEMLFSTMTGDAKAAGSVEVTQKGREARADSAFYDDKRELLTLSGNVFMKKGKDWISCQKIIISVRKETFEAFGVAEARFKL